MPEMQEAKTGDTVEVHYTGKLDDGTVFDSSKDRSPLKFTIGEGELIPGFEKAVLGMHPGESRTAKIPADDAYGTYREDLTMAVDRNQFPSSVEPGQRYRVENKDGSSLVVRVVDVSDSKVTLDANHPLAGKNLTFDIELVDILH